MGEQETFDASVAAGRQAIYRAVNERMGRLFEPVAVAGDQFPIACECGNAECVEMLAVTDVEYDAVRRSASRYVVRPGHELLAVERVVAETERFAVVERLDGDDEAGAQERESET